MARRSQWAFAADCWKEWLARSSVQPFLRPIVWMMIPLAALLAILLFNDSRPALSPLPGDLRALPAPPLDPRNPVTPAKVELGKQLFNDVRLSGDQSLSCASCHPREMAYTETVPFSAGAHGQPMGRNTPTLLNVAYYRHINWDGKFASIAQLIPAVMVNPRVMNLQDESVLVARLESVPAYRTSFRAVFGGPPTRERVVLAIDAYIRRLTTPNSPFDRYAAGDSTALTPAQQRGLALFAGKARCVLCHHGPNFEDDSFHSLGLATDDPGRFNITARESDRNAFKTPTIRNTTRTAPYMHDGSLATLRDVVDFFDAGGGAQQPKAIVLRPLHLTEAEKGDLVAFLETTTGRVE